MLKAYPRHSVELGKSDLIALLRYILSACRANKEKYMVSFGALFAAYTGVRHALPMPSARLALYVLLQHFRFPEGAEVIITPFTHQSIFTVLKSFRLKPVFVDIDAGTHNTDPVLVKRAITDKTALIIVTHMWGQPCDMDAFVRLKQEHPSIRIIEDCAMACGAVYKGKKAGSFADAGIFSFGKAKAICAFGGGMLCTDDAAIHEYARAAIKDFSPPQRLSLASSVVNSLIAGVLTRPRLFFASIYPLMRLFDLRDPYNPAEHRKDSEEILERMPDSWKVRMSALQAAVGAAQLDNLDRRNARRIQNAMLLTELLSDVDSISLPQRTPGAQHIYLYYALHIKKKYELNKLRKRLLASAVDTQLNELTTPRQLSVFGAQSRDFPVFDAVSGNILIIPNGIYLQEKDIYAVADAIRENI